jgi:hypothetical protein
MGTVGPFDTFGPATPTSSGLHLDTVPPQGDGAGGTTLARLEQLALLGGGRVERDGDALIVQVERLGGPEQAIPRAHALVAVDPNLKFQGAKPVICTPFLHRLGGIVRRRTGQGLW